MMKKDLIKLFDNLCCSRCKHGFEEDSITVKREENGLLVTTLECKYCGKSFGVAFIGLSKGNIKEPLEVQEGPEPINYDDVIDAHRFIKNLDEHWQDYLK